MTFVVASRIKKRRRRRAELLSRYRVFALAAMSFIANEIRRRSERHFVRHTLDLHNMPQDEFRFYFRMESYDDFLLLLESLEIPSRIVCDNGTTVSAELGLAVVLRRLAYPNRWGDVMYLLGREKTQLSRIFNATINQIYQRKGFLLETLDWVSAQQVARYAEAIRVASGYYGKSWKIFSWDSHLPSDASGLCNSCETTSDGTPIVSK